MKRKLIQSESAETRNSRRIKNEAGAKINSQCDEGIELGDLRLGPGCRGIKLGDIGRGTSYRGIELGDLRLGPGCRGIRLGDLDGGTSCRGIKLA